MFSLLSAELSECAPSRGPMMHLAELVRDFILPAVEQVQDAAAVPDAVARIYLNVRPQDPKSGAPSPSDELLKGLVDAVPSPARSADMDIEVERELDRVMDLEQGKVDMGHELRSMIGDLVAPPRA